MTKARKTSISWVAAEKIKLRGFAIEDLIGNISWGEALGLLLLGAILPKNHAQMLEAILISVIDHGVRPPSTIAAVTVANTGASLNSAVAAGISFVIRHSSFLRHSPPSVSLRCWPVAPSARLARRLTIGTTTAPPPASARRAARGRCPRRAARPRAGAQIRVATLCPETSPPLLPMTSTSALPRMASLLAPSPSAAP